MRLYDFQIIRGLPEVDLSAFDQSFEERVTH